MITGEMLHKSFVRAVNGYDVRWADLGEPYKALYTAMAGCLNTFIIDDGAAERDALRSQISQLQANINSLGDTILRIEQERDAFQQLALKDTHHAT